jgi:hypothetical protein
VLRRIRLDDMRRHCCCLWCNPTWPASQSSIKVRIGAKECTTHAVQARVSPAVRGCWPVYEGVSGMGTQQLCWHASGCVSYTLAYRDQGSHGHFSLLCPMSNVWCVWCVQSAHHLFGSKAENKLCSIKQPHGSAVCRRLNTADECRRW